MIAILIFYAGKLIAKEELDINNFFSFLAAMMLAYQPVRSLATLNLTINQGLAASKRILPVIDQKHSVIEDKNLDDLKVHDGTNWQMVKAVASISAGVQTNPVDGQLHYNKSTNKLVIYDLATTAWINIGP